MTQSRDRVAEVLLDPPEHTRAMPVTEVMSAAWRVRETTAEAILVKHHIGLSKTVGGLTVRQAAELAADLRGQDWVGAFGEAA